MPDNSHVVAVLSLLQNGGKALSFYGSRLIGSQLTDR